MAAGAGRFRADVLVKKVPKRGWQKLSAGRGAKGQRFYDGAVVDLVDLVDPTPGSHQLLIRRSRTTGELAYDRCHPTEPVPLTVLVKTAGSRWRVEETFQAEKGLAGLDEHQVRRYRSWTRWERQPARATRPVGRAASRPGLVRLVGSAGGSGRDVPGGGRAEVMNASPDHP
ncbi:hypothetical protein SAMN02787118_106422 [Streptomyces mirabilis]|jgi:hypothetical protein|uniref:Transposase n=1 Tax=Streptomyces mirabilis TaxID=68239 RepID=A0A1I2IPE8_9ACTN|nr:hypothetical protein SAMN02787118_106422 [Streptomyces mirabilis]